jgi:hypothetical protein
VTLPGRKKKKAGMDLSAETEGSQIDTNSVFVGNKKFRSPMEGYGLQEPEAGVAVAGIQPRRSL